jgi:hypothetical protein
MPIEFPVPTFIGQTFFAGGKGWRWNGFAWDSIANTQAIGATGPIGATGLTGQSSTFYNYKADTTITSGTPAINTLYWNNATQISSAVVTLSHIDALGNDLDVFFPLFKTNDTFVIQDQSNSNNFQTWKISATPTVVLNSYISMPVTLVTSGGTSQFTNNQQLIFAIVTSGLQGGTGATGVGSTGATGVGYDGVTSTTTTVPSSSGSITMTTNAQGAFVTGNRVRVINSAFNYFEGIVFISAGTSFQIFKDFSVGTTSASSWTITLAGVQGATGVGATGATGVGYDGVTSTSFAVPASSGAVVTLIPNKQGAFISGSRVRAINTSSNYFEGTLAIPFGGAFQITQDFNVGTTPASSWTITLAGVRGQQGSTGATGLVGATGLQGNVGSTGATGLAAVVTPGTTNNAIVLANGNSNNSIKGSNFIVNDNTGFPILNTYDYPDSISSPFVNITRTGTTAFVVTSNPHGLSTGQSVSVSGASISTFNGVKVVTVTGLFTFQYTVTSGSTSPSGTIVIRTGIIYAQNHNFVTGQRIWIRTITGGTGLTDGTYFVRNVSGQTFQLSSTLSGSIIFYTTSITAGTVNNSPVDYTQLLANGTSTDIALVLSPKGTGAIQVEIPDGTTANGNSRGQYSVDFQSIRGSANQVVSGNYSGLIAGSSNQIDANYSGILAGSSNSISGIKDPNTGNPVAGGNLSSIISSTTSYNNSNNSSIISSDQSGITFAEITPGLSDFPEQQFNVLLNGFNNTITNGFYSVGINASSSTISNVEFSTISGVYATGKDWCETKSNNIYGQLHRGIILSNETTNATPTDLVISLWRAGGVPVPFYIPTTTIYAFHIKVAGVQVGGANASFFSRQGMIKNVAGTTSLVGAISTIGTDIETNAATAISITANDTNDSLKVTVTGIAAQTWRWVAELKCIEIRGF